MIEHDCQCARCGSSCDFTRCDECGGEGFYEDGGDDYDDFPITVQCENCGGKGGWWACLSSPEYCEAHRRPGCEETKRGEVKWYSFEMKDNDAH